jgi:succinate dehydrogenase/fumarate reductase flavoprotein subunit
MDRLQYFLPGKSSARETKLLVSPTTHFAMGGVRIDTGGATGLPGLFAAGEVTSGMHGANRLGGNAITEILVMGNLAGEKAAERARAMAVKPDVGSGATEEVIRLALLGSPTGTTEVKELAEVLKKAMWYHAGIIRTKEGLENVLVTLDSVEQSYSIMLVGNAQQLWDAVELCNMVTVSRMICKAALERTESRGSHYRQDHPAENSGEWLKNIIISNQQGRMTLSHKNVEMVTVVP